MVVALLVVLVVLVLPHQSADHLRIMLVVEVVLVKALADQVATVVAVLAVREMLLVQRERLTREVVAVVLLLTLDLILVVTLALELSSFLMLAHNNSVVV
jgi:hypothetical protein